MYMKPIKVEKHLNESLIKTHIHCGICLSDKLKMEEYFYMQIPDASIRVFTWVKVVDRIWVPGNKKRKHTNKQIRFPNIFMTLYAIHVSKYDRM